MYGSYKFLVLPLLCPGLASIGRGADTAAPLQQKIPAGALQPLPRSRTASLVRPRPPILDSGVLTVLPGHRGCRLSGGHRSPREAGAGARGKQRARLSHSPTTTPQLQGGSCPTPAPVHGQQPGLLHLSPSPKRPALALGCTGEYHYAHFID